MSWPPLIWGRAKSIPDHFQAKSNSSARSLQKVLAQVIQAPLIWLDSSCTVTSRLGFSLDFGLQYNSLPSDISHTTLLSLWLPTDDPYKTKYSPPSRRAKHESCEILEASWFSRVRATRTRIEKRTYHEFGNYSIRGEDRMALTALQQVSGQVSRGTN